MHEAIPFLDLVSPHRELEEECIEVFREALRTGMFIGGPVVQKFEEKFASFCEARHCIGVGSGTDALRFALIATGVGAGDIVVTVPNTFIATTEAVSQSGAVPAFIDVDPRTYTMNPEKLRNFLEADCAFDTASGRTVHRESSLCVRAVIPVHLYGQTADMDPIMDLAERHGLIVIEDACQAHGAQYFSKKGNRWMKAGSIGAAAAFSFYPGKNLGACGEAGAVTTGNAEVTRSIRMLRDHGQSRKYHHDIEGYNGRLDAIQAGVLGVKLKRLQDWNEQRRNLAHSYDALLAPVGDIALPYEPEWSRGVYHLYVIRTRLRDGLQKHLSERGISSGLHYPLPLHQQKAYSTIRHYRGDLTEAEEAAREILSLPMFPNMSAAQQMLVASAVLSFFEKTDSANVPSYGPVLKDAPIHEPEKSVRF